VTDADQEFNRLCRLVKRGDLAAVGAALDAGTSPNLKDVHGYPLLFSAAHTGNVAVGELLISRGADIDLNVFGVTALSTAFFAGHVRFMQLLLDHGADPDCRPNGLPIEDWMGAVRLSSKKEAIVLRMLATYRARNSN
jgi:uncharacterized protein